jgi:hypothetical protein
MFVLIGLSSSSFYRRTPPPCVTAQDPRPEGDELKQFANGAVFGCSAKDSLAMVRAERNLAGNHRISTRTGNKSDHGQRGMFGVDSLAHGMLAKQTPRGSCLSVALDECWFAWPHHQCIKRSHKLAWMQYGSV